MCSSRSEQRATLKMLRNKLSSRGLDTKEEEKDSDRHLRRHWVCVFSSYRGVSASARSDQSRKRVSASNTRPDPAASINNEQHTVSFLKKEFEWGGQIVRSDEVDIFLRLLRF